MPDAISKLSAATSRLATAERQWFEAIRAAHTAQWSIDVIAKAAGVTEAEIRKILKPK